LFVTVDHPGGAYRPIWLARADLTQHDVRPHALAAALARGLPPTDVGVLRIED